MNIRDAIGTEAMRKLQKLFGGQKVYVPKLGDLDPEAVLSQHLRNLKAGMTYTESVEQIARGVCRSESWIREVIGKVKRSE